jgi:hypothetical protein
VPGWCGCRSAPLSNGRIRSCASPTRSVTRTRTSTSSTAAIASAVNHPSTRLLRAPRGPPRVEHGHPVVLGVHEPGGVDRGPRLQRGEPEEAGRVGDDGDVLGGVDEPAHPDRAAGRGGPCRDEGGVPQRGRTARAYRARAGAAPLVARTAPVALGTSSRSGGRCCAACDGLAWTTAQPSSTPATATRPVRRRDSSPLRRTTHCTVFGGPLLPHPGPQWRRLQGAPRGGLLGESLADTAPGLGC